MKLLLKTAVVNLRIVHLLCFSNTTQFLKYCVKLFGGINILSTFTVQYPIKEKPRTPIKIDFYAIQIIGYLTTLSP